MLKTKYNTDKTELENKIPGISNLATKTALTAVENKIPSAINLVKKRDYTTKITDIENKLNNHNHDKYIGTSEFNKLAADVFNEISMLNCQILTEKLLKINRNILENELNKLKTFDSGYFVGKSHFGADGTQSYLVFQLMYRYLF